MTIEEIKEELAILEAQTKEEGFTKDASENSNMHMVNDRIDELQQMLMDKEDALEIREVIKDGSIQVGSFFTMFYLMAEASGDDVDTPPNAIRCQLTARVDDLDDTLQQDPYPISVSSPIGEQIHNKFPGTYTVQTKNGMVMVEVRY